MENRSYQNSLTIRLHATLLNEMLATLIAAASLNSVTALKAINCFQLT